MPHLDITFIILLVLAALSYVTNNYTVTFAVIILLVFRVTPLSQFFPILQHHGIAVGIIILTTAILVPLANGSLTALMLFKSLANWQSFLAVVVGIFVSWLGMRGVGLMESNPMIVNGLIIGTLIGVAFFRGISVGPLIAAGLLSIFLGKT